MPTPPPDVEALIKKYTNSKLPYFFRYAKDKSRDQVEKPTTSTVNRIMKSVSKKTLVFSEEFDGEFNHEKLKYKDIDEPSEDIKNRVCKKYLELARTRIEYNKGQKTRDHIAYTAAIDNLRDLLIESGNGNLKATINTLVDFLFIERPNIKKSILWDCFGEELYNNLLSATLDDRHRICIDCGRPFELPSGRGASMKVRCDECGLLDRKRKEALRKRNNRKNNI